MRRHRAYVDHPLSIGTSMTLPAGVTRHLLGTLRLRRGDPIVLFNGDGHDYPARLLEAARDGAVAEVVDRGPPEAPTTLDIHVGLGISRGERMDFALQKATELGVTAITPVFTERCVVRLDGERTLRRMSHWQAVVASACAQSGRRRLPRVDTPLPLVDFDAADTGLNLVLSPTADRGLSQLAPPAEPSVRLLVGPEGGLGELELDRMIARGFTAIRLGPRILRTETAPLAAIAALQVLWGDLG